MYGPFSRHHETLKQALEATGYDKSADNLVIFTLGQACLSEPLAQGDGLVKMIHHFIVPPGNVVVTV